MWILRSAGALVAFFLLGMAVTGALALDEGGPPITPITRAAVSAIFGALGLVTLRLSSRWARVSMDWIGERLGRVTSPLRALLPPRMRAVRPRTAVITIIALLLTGAIVEGGIIEARRQRPMKEFYRSLVAQPLPLDTGIRAGYVRGRLLVVELPDGPPYPVPADKAFIPLINRDLPADLRARDVTEIGTVATVTCGDDRVGSYSNLGTPGRGAPGAYRRWCHVGLIDATTRRVIGDTTLYGSAPPARASGRAYGSRARPLVRPWLEQLPRRNATASPDSSR